MRHTRRIGMCCLAIAGLVLMVSVPRGEAREYRPQIGRDTKRPAVVQGPGARQRKPARPFRQVTRASWYGNSFRGKRMAGGGRFNPNKLTAAHRTLRMGTNVKVTNVRTGRWVVVKITDRGPYFPGRGIDLSYAAAREIGIVKQGVADVRIEEVVEEAAVPPSPSPIITAMCGAFLSWLPQAVVE